MSSQMPLIHPSDAIFAGEKSPALLPAVNHYAGNEKFILKALQLQNTLGPVFDITCDCEDGAPAGHEAAHAEMCAAFIMSPENRFNRVGVRIHDISHPHWRKDLEILVEKAGNRLAFMAFPKLSSARNLASQLMALRDAEANAGLTRLITAHVLIETHGALRQVWEMAAQPGVASLDFGLMDFVSSHHGAISVDAMKSPGQFEHPLLRRAKAEVVAAALAHGLVPTHNVTTAIEDPNIAANDAHRARHEFGFLRMWSIHPSQIEPILNAMRPSAEELATAQTILCAAQEVNWGPIRYQGILHDRGSFRYYWTLLQRAHASGQVLTPEIVSRFFPSA